MNKLDRKREDVRVLRNHLLSFLPHVRSFTKAELSYMDDVAMQTRELMFSDDLYALINAEEIAAEGVVVGEFVLLRSPM
jgi:hypothetical protein